jgi:hypothetical protein
MDDEKQVAEESKETTVAPAVAIPWIRNPDVIMEAYSNVLYVNWSLHDVRIRFGQIIPHPTMPPENATWAVNEGADITIPWGQVKYLRDTLNDVIERYEKANGELKIPTMPT